MSGSYWNLLLYGSPEPLPERVALSAGPLSLFFENGDLRYVCFGDKELLRRIYIAMRDANWGTVPVRIAGLAGDVRIRRLNAENAIFSMTDPERYRSGRKTEMPASADGLETRLQPFELVRLEVTGEET